MPFNRPDPKTIFERIVNDIETRLGTGKTLRNSVISVLSKAYSGAVYLLHGHIEWAVKQLLPDSAEKEYLERWSGIWGITRKSAGYATGHVVFTGADGSVIPSGTELKRGADESLYVTTAAGTITGGTVTVPVKAVNAGTAADATAGETLSFTTPVSGVNSTAAVSGGITDGTDIEDDESLRERVVSRIQLPPHGGAEFDYKKWAKEISGVTRAWVYPKMYGLGTVGLTFVMDGESTIIPSVQKVAEVQAYIDDNRPVTADVTVFAPTAVPINFQINITPATTGVKKAVEDGLRDLLTRDAVPGGTILISRIREAVSTAAGESDNNVVTPTADISYTTGQMPVFGAITWM